MKKEEVAKEYKQKMMILCERKCKKSMKKRDYISEKNLKFC